METNSIHSNYSKSSEQFPIINDGTAKSKVKAKYLESFPDIKPYKLDQLSEFQKASLQDFSCGNGFIDEFLRHGDYLRFQVDRHKMRSMIMATEAKVLGYMAYSIKDVTFSIPDMCSKALKERNGLTKGDKIFVLHYLGIDESCKEQGLGKSLVLKAFNTCLEKAKTDSSLKLMVLHATPEAGGFYEKIGFHKIGKLDSGLIEYAYTVNE